MALASRSRRSAAAGLAMEMKPSGVTATMPDDAALRIWAVCWRSCCWVGAVGERGPVFAGFLGEDFFGGVFFREGLDLAAPGFGRVFRLAAFTRALRAVPAFAVLRFPAISFLDF